MTDRGLFRQKGVSCQCRNKVDKEIGNTTMSWCSISQIFFRKSLTHSITVRLRSISLSYKSISLFFIFFFALVTNVMFFSRNFSNNFEEIYPLSANSLPKMILIFLPPYSPELNPIEKERANLKQWLAFHLHLFSTLDDAISYYFKVNCLIQDTLTLISAS